MKLNEIREIVDFMKEAGVCELEYKERSTSIRLKLTPPAPQYPWGRFRTSASEASEPREAADTPAEPVEDEGINVEIDLNKAVEKVRRGAVKAGSAMVGTVKAGARYVKSKRDEYLTGTPGAYDVELSEAEEAEPEAAPAPGAAPVPEASPEPASEPAPVGEEAESAPEADESIPEDPAPVKLDTDAAKEAVVRTAEVVAYAAKAAVELGVAGVRRGGALLSDLLRSDDEVPDLHGAPEEDPGEKPGAPEEDPDRKDEE